MKVHDVKSVQPHFDDVSEKKKDDVIEEMNHILVTDEMIEAGRDQVYDLTADEAKRVYLAMERERIGCRSRNCDRRPLVEPPVIV